jgi:hypothetical protein
MHSREVSRMQGSVGASELHFTLTPCLIAEFELEKVEDFFGYKNYNFGYSTLVSSSNVI